MVDIRQGKLQLGPGSRFVRRRGCRIDRKLRNGAVDFARCRQTVAVIVARGSRDQGMRLSRFPRLGTGLRSTSLTQRDIGQRLRGIEHCNVMMVPMPPMPPVCEHPLVFHALAKLAVLLARRFVPGVLPGRMVCGLFRAGRLVRLLPVGRPVPVRGSMPARRAVRHWCGRRTRLAGARRGHGQSRA